jgi:diguanylate cyclase (GGDEF)-like protein
MGEDAVSVADEAKCTLLLVDDESAVLESLAHALQKDYDVATAASAEEALQVLQQKPIDIILTDQRLPGISGVQFLENVRKNYPRIVRLLMTGYAEFENMIQAINNGQVFRYLIKPWRISDLQNTLSDAARMARAERQRDQLLAELNSINQRLEKVVRERTLELEQTNRQLQQRNLMLEKLSLTDSLTSLSNRRAIEQILQNEVRRRARYPSPLTIALIDLDHFKEVNTRYLHPGGDQVLIRLGQTLNAVIRSADTVGRLGGEEFLVVAPQTDLEGAFMLGERIRSAVERMAVDYKSQTIRITTSVGLVVAASDCHPTAEQLIHEASAVLAEAKAAGRNRCVVHQTSGCPAAEPENVVSG